ncbi:hypothetical protein COD86_21495 [Bacillus cereus]|nr:hypothetical protein COD14_17185 [Bacillus cereus]PGV92066.1 hypothetical protein COD86_21495 [Bacillus cereus]
MLRVEIFECSSQKYNPFLAELLALYIESEKEQVYKSRKKAVIPMFLRFFIVIEFDNYEVIKKPV